MQVGSLGQENPLEDGMAIHSSILAWRKLLNRSFLTYQMWIIGSTSQENQFSSVTQLCWTLWDPMDCSMPGSFV